MRRVFQEGLRPAVSRLYDPFDALLAKMGGVKGKSANARSGAADAARTGRDRKPKAPGLGGVALRSILRRPFALNELIDLRAGAPSGARCWSSSSKATEMGHARICSGRGRCSSARVDGTTARTRPAAGSRTGTRSATGRRPSTRRAPGSTRWRWPRPGQPRRALRRRPAGARAPRVRHGAPQSRVPRRLLHLLLVRRERAARRDLQGRRLGRGEHRDVRAGVARRRSRRRRRQGGRSRTTTAWVDRRRHDCGARSGRASRSCGP